jgi:bifunctional non-homologous end joining protein LigD
MTRLRVRVGLAEFVKRVEVPSSEEGPKTRMMVNDLPGLLSLVQIYAVEIHTWGARADRLDRPDRLVFDLDPHESVPWQRVKQAAVDLRNLLAELGLESFLLATGGKGLHIVVPIACRYGWDRAKAFAHEVSKRLAATSSREFTTSPSLAARGGKIFIDYLRNRRGATFIAPYSPRARAGAPVAVPLQWDELDKLQSADAFDIARITRRVVLSLGASKPATDGRFKTGQWT